MIILLLKTFDLYDVLVIVFYFILKTDLLKKDDFEYLN